MTENVGCTQGKRVECAYYMDVLKMCNCVSCGTGSSVGIPNDYELDGPGSNPGENEIFRPSRPALKPTQPPVKWVLGFMAGACC